MPTANCQLRLNSFVPDAFPPLYRTPTDGSPPFPTNHICLDLLAGTTPINLFYKLMSLSIPKKTASKTHIIIQKHKQQKDGLDGHPEARVKEICAGESKRGSRFASNPNRRRTKKEKTPKKTKKKHEELPGRRSRPKNYS